MAAKVADKYTDVFLQQVRAPRHRVAVSATLKLRSHMLATTLTLNGIVFVIKLYLRDFRSWAFPSFYDELAVPCCHPMFGLLRETNLGVWYQCDRRVLLNLLLL